MDAFARKLATPPALIPITAAGVVCWSLIGLFLAQLLQATGGTGLLDLKFGYSAETVRAHFAAYDDGGWPMVFRIQVLDLVNPALYALLLVAALSRIGMPGPVLWLPVACAALDYSENAVIVLMIRAWPDLPGRLVDIGNALSMVKHSVLLLTILALVVGLFRWLRS